MSRSRALLTLAVAGLIVAGSTIAITVTHRAGGDALPTPSEARRMLVQPAAAPRAVQVGDDTPARGFRTVVFFLADGDYPAFVDTLRGWGPLADSRAAHPADIVAILPHKPHGPYVITPVGSDPSGTLARAYGIAGAPDGGPPVGYAIVDSQLRVRYATGDPDILDHVDEVAVILEALP